MSNSDVVKYVYERLAQGDLPAILANFDREIEFRLAEGHPYSPAGTTWIGADAITKNFFLKSGPEWEGWAMRVDELTEMGDAIVVEGRYAGLYKPTGKRMDLQVCHIWKFRDGKITSFHQYLDTARLQDVMRGQSGERVAS